MMRVLFPVFALLLAAGPALSQVRDEATRVAEGKRLAEINCTRCHNIEAEGESPLTDAPPFREIAKNYDELELVDGFMEGLAVRHPLMPDWEVTEPQAENLAAFVMSLGTGSKAASDPATQGFNLLRANSARCHAIDEASLSPEPKAPPFRVIVTKYKPEMLEEALAEGIMTGHEEMPVFAFEPDEATAIIAYLETLKGE